MKNCLKVMSNSSAAKADPHETLALRGEPKTNIKLFTPSESKTDAGKEVIMSGDEPWKYE